MMLYLFCADPDTLRTPQAQKVAEPCAMPTPGHLVAESQAQLTKNMFVSVLGEAEVSAWCIDWPVLQDTARDFEDPQKRTALRLIGKNMTVLARTVPQSKDFDGLLGLFTRISSMAQGVHEERLKEHTLRYFQGKFPDSQIGFAIKTDGDQLGTIATISGPTPVRYYIKTHAGGLKSEHSSAAKPVNGVELMIYQILALFAIGPEVHFFGRDACNFYIATKDANCDGRFMEYSKIKEKPGVVWGVLTRLPEEAAQHAAQSEDIESAIASDMVAQNFIEQMVTLDLLARLMKLTDLHRNSSNFGFITFPGQPALITIIDFRFEDTRLMDKFTFTPDSFGGFIDGNTIFRHREADKAMCYTLKTRPVEKRVTAARRIMTTHFMNYSDQIDTAKIAVASAVTTSGLTPEQKRILIEEAHGYADIIKANFAFFSEKLAAWEGAPQ